jgi:hypothetical protein
VLLLVALSVGAGYAPAAEGLPKPQKSVSKTEADGEIEQNLLAKLAKSKLAADHFTVSVSHGVATLEGVTDVPQHKGIMTRMAKASGASAVRNNIRMSAAAKAKTTGALAKARAKGRRVRVRTGTSVPVPHPSKTPEVPHAKVLPEN